MSRWLIEPSTGVFVGNPSARVRDELWDKTLAAASEGSALQIWTSQTPQGFTYRQHNPGHREMVDVEGVSLVRVLTKESSRKKRA